MKKTTFSLIGGLLFGSILLSGCSTSKAVGKGVAQGFGNVFRSTKMPSPQAGLVPVVHRSSAVWAQCFLFQDSLHEKELIVTQNGKMNFAYKPLAYFSISPPINQVKGSMVPNFVIRPLILSSESMDYTLLVFYQNFRDKVSSGIYKNGVIELSFRKVKAHRFSTTGYGLNKYKIGGRIIHADKIVRLARVRPYKNRQLKIKVLLDPGNWIKEIIGL